MKLFVSIALAALVCLHTALQALPTGVDPDQQLVFIPRDYGIIYSIANPTSQTITTIIYTDGQEDIIWGIEVEPFEIIQGIVTLPNVTVSVQTTYYDMSVNLQTHHILDDFNRPMTAEMQIVAEAIRIVNTATFLDRVRSKFISHPALPEPLRAPYTAILMKSAQILSLQSQSAEDFVRRSLDDLRTPVANALGESSAFVPLEIRVLFLLTFYEVSVEIANERVVELQSVIDQAPETIDMSFVATFQVLED
jgi:hypothetical protein